MPYFYNMNIFIVAATLREIEPFLNKVRISNNYSNRYIQATYEQHMLDVHVSGIGMVAMADRVARFIHENHDMAFNIGIAGSFSRNIELGSVVNVVEDHLSELGAQDGDKFLTLEDMQLQGQDRFINKSLFLNNVINQLPKVEGITVNTVHGNEKSIREIDKRLNPVIESMEGAAFMYSCQFETIPYAQIRAISNFVERRNRPAWDIPLAVNNLSNKMIDILKAFSKT